MARGPSCRLQQPHRNPRSTQESRRAGEGGNSECDLWEPFDRRRLKILSSAYFLRRQSPHHLTNKLLSFSPTNTERRRDDRALRVINVHLNRRARTGLNSRPVVVFNANKHAEVA